MSKDQDNFEDNFEEVHYKIISDLFQSDDLEIKIGINNAEDWEVSGTEVTDKLHAAFDSFIHENELGKEEYYLSTDFDATTQYLTIALTHCSGEKVVPFSGSLPRDLKLANDDDLNLTPTSSSLYGKYWELLKDSQAIEITIAVSDDPQVNERLIRKLRKMISNHKSKDVYFRRTYPAARINVTDFDAETGKVTICLTQMLDINALDSMKR